MWSHKGRIPSLTSWSQTHLQARTPTELPVTTSAPSSAADWCRARPPSCRDSVTLCCRDCRAVRSRDAEILGRRDLVMPRRSTVGAPRRLGSVEPRSRDAVTLSCRDAMTPKSRSAVTPRPRRVMTFRWPLYAPPHTANKLRSAATPRHRDAVKSSGLLALRLAP